MMRRIGAVLAGLVTIAVLDNAIDAVMHLTGIYPPYGQPMRDSLFVLATAYRAVDSTLGCFITARLAPDRPLAHALTLGGIGVLLSLSAAVVTWNVDPPLGPRWYSLALPAMALPVAWIGGTLGARARSR
jgi:hypothetical protein